MPKNNKTHIAVAKCKMCGKKIISHYGGDFQSCPCGESFIDQERFGGLYVRLGGSADFVEQICPIGCTIETHKTNKKKAK